MRFLLQVLVLAALLSSASMAQAGDGPKDKGHCGKGLRVRCPNCCHECIYTAEKAKETKSCYEVECKEICIPRIVFPWQKCGCGKGHKGGKGCGDGKGGCGHNRGAKSKSVRVLVKYEYECSVCEYKWNPVSKYSDKIKDEQLKPLEAPPMVSGSVPDTTTR